jgi:flagellar basal-body rod modification protein FlgD
VNTGNVKNDALSGLFGASTPTAEKKGAKKDLDESAFMTLLVAQLKHQDPLEPQDGTQFVAQLATFNSLDQLININQRLGKLIDLSKK